MNTPPITPKTFPYQRKWTKTQIEEITARYMRIADVLTDAVGPVGQVMYVDAVHINNLALHGALAGLDTHPELAYIVPVIHNQSGMPADFHEWVLKDEYRPPAPTGDKDKRAEEQAQKAADQIRRQLPPEVRKRVAKMMIEEYQKATEDKDDQT